MYSYVTGLGVMKLHMALRKRKSFIKLHIEFRVSTNFAFSLSLYRLIDYDYLSSSS